MKALPLVQPAGKRKKPISRGALATISIFLGAPIVPLLADTPFQPPPFKVRDGFEITLAAAPPLLKYPMMACLDDMGNLYVAESDGRNLTTREEIENEIPRFIRRLTDTDGDGIFDRSTIFADKMTMPEGGSGMTELSISSPHPISGGWRIPTMTAGQTSAKIAIVSMMLIPKGTSPPKPLGS